MAAALTETRRLGRTDVVLTVLGLGGAPLGNLLAAVDESQALATIEAALASGVRYFDVAPQYGHGLAEHRVGHVLRQHPRRSFVLSSKVGRLCRPSRAPVQSAFFRDPLPFVLEDCYTRDAILRSIEDSYQRLGLSEIDVVFVHDVDPANHPGERLERLFRQVVDEAFPTLAELKALGVIRAVGVGNNSTEMCERFARAADFDCFLIAGRYTLLEQEALDTFLPLCESRGIGVVIGGPFNSGILATGAVTGALHDYAPAPAEVLARVRRIEAVCRAHRVPLAAAALQFPLAHPAVAAVIPGARSPAEWQNIAASLAVPVPPALWRDLVAEGLLRARAPVPAEG